MAGSPTVLVVDDNERNLKLACAVLEAAGITVVGALSGAQALERAAGRGVDLVLLDVRLPDLDGTEVLKRLRSDPDTADLIVVALTSLGPDEAGALLELGFDGYLEKPIDVRTFPAEVLAFGGLAP
jgi:two-component system cell cycle response regulator DivK